MSFKHITSEKLREKDQKLKTGDLQALLEWLSKQPHLPQIEEYQFCIFLQSLEYSLELTKTTIDKYFSLRSQQPEVFKSLTKEEFIAATNVISATFLPKLTPNNSRVLLFKLLDTKAENLNCLKFFRMLIMLGSLYFHQRGYISDVILVCDLKGFHLGHFPKLDIMGIKHLVDISQSALPVHLTGLHFINGFSFGDKIKFLGKPFLKTEAYNMMEFHSSLDSLYKFVPKDVLPAECDGGDVSIETLIKKNTDWVLQNFDFFAWHDQQIVNETKRIQKRSDTDGGIDGSFRKLDID